MAMISPWMENGDLLGYIRRNPAVSRFKLMIEISAGVAYLHKFGAIHGDIKSVREDNELVEGNILISREGVAKLADFGCTQLKKNTLHFTTTTGTPGYSLRWAAPEVLSGDQIRSKEADIYALGMTLLEVVTGHPPFYNKPDMAVLRMLKPSGLDVEITIRLLVLRTYISPGCQINSDSCKLKEVERHERGRPSHIEESSALTIPPIVIDSPVADQPDEHDATFSINERVRRPYSYTPAPAISRSPSISMPIPEVWGDPDSLRRSENADDAAMMAHIRALEEARKLVEETSEDEKEESRLRDVISKIGDHDDTESESESSSGGTGVMSQNDVPPRDKHNPSPKPSRSDRDLNNRNNRNNRSNYNSYNDEKSLENESINSVKISDTLSSPSSASSHPGRIDGLPGTYAGAPGAPKNTSNRYNRPAPLVTDISNSNSRWDPSHLPGVTFVPPGLPDFTNFDTEPDSPKREPAAAGLYHNPSRSSGRGSANNGTIPRSPKGRLAGSNADPSILLRPPKPPSESKQSHKSRKPKASTPSPQSTSSLPLAEAPIRPAPYNNGLQSPFHHMPVPIMPEGWIPEKTEDGKIHLPPAHEIHPSPLMVNRNPGEPPVAPTPSIIAPTPIPAHRRPIPMAHSPTSVPAIMSTLKPISSSRVRASSATSNRRPTGDMESVPRAPRSAPIPSPVGSPRRPDIATFKSTPERTRKRQLSQSESRLDMERSSSRTRAIVEAFQVSREQGLQNEGHRVRFDHNRDRGRPRRSRSASPSESASSENSSVKAVAGSSSDEEGWDSD
ncbi:hypothetical protein FRC09_016590 [Ceratobasidium sp. 395]|nr:hypothetical protein FRC09_016590 [Ceratobasidium sp. 395]